MWIFYDQNQIATNYNIAEEDFIFYWLYSVVIIPFQVIIDILHYNIAEYYNDVPIFEYVKSIGEKFKRRKTNWKGDEDDVDYEMDPKCQLIDQWCYSSQYYFILTIFMSGIFMVTLGNQTMIAADYPLFGDMAIIYILLTFCALCLVLYFATLYVGKKLKIWVVNPTEGTEKAETKNKNDELDLSGEEKLALVTRFLFSKKYSSHQFTFRKFGNWKKVKLVKLATDNLDEVTREIQRTTFNDEKLRNQLLLDNSHWFTSNVKEVLTPTTLKRFLIITLSFSLSSNPIADDVRLLNPLNRFMANFHHVKNSMKSQSKNLSRPDWISERKKS